MMCRLQISKDRQMIHLCSMSKIRFAHEGQMSGQISAWFEAKDKCPDICPRSDVLFFRDKSPSIVDNRWYIWLTWVKHTSPWGRQFSLSYDHSSL